MDADRNYQYKPFPGMPRPAKPQFPFDTKPFSDDELRREVWKKRNGSAAGMNGIPYTVYKRCPRVLQELGKIMRSAQRLRTVAQSWQIGRVTLIPKSGDNSQPGLMRDITILNVEGRLFWSVFQRRVANFMLENGYIPRAVQKAFLEGVAGCVEHATAVGEAVRDARERERQLVLVWLDLKNAYGSVRHAMIQFALKWYHVPREIVELFVNYIEGICFQVQTEEWSGEWFGLGIGVPKGCTASTIVFDVAFQLVLDIHLFLTEGKTSGYTLSGSSVCVKAPAYADDVCLAEVSTEDAQMSLQQFDRALTWTKTMALKPPKCKSLAFRKFRHGELGKGHGPYDPRLVLGGEVLKFVGDEDTPVFKYVGRGIQSDGKEDIVLQGVADKLDASLEKVEATLLTGPMKSWIVDVYVMATLAWALMIHDFSDTAVLVLHKAVHRSHRKWVRLAKCADGSVLYRSNVHCGLGFKNVVEVKRRLQVVRWHIMKNSLDQQARKLYSHRLARDKAGHVGQGRRSSPCLQLEEALGALRLEDIKGRTQTGRHGLGFVRQQKSEVSERARVKRWMKEEEEAKRVAALFNYQMQAGWLQWSDDLQDMMEKDLSWKKMLYQYSDRLLRFVVNSLQNTLPTPDNLLRWNSGVSKGGDAQCLRRWSNQRSYACGLCGKVGATALHILAGCPWVHNVENTRRGRGRYTWRHNRTLSRIAKSLASLVSKVNAKAAGIAEGKDGRRALGRGLGREVAFVKAEEVGIKAQRTVVKAEEEKWCGRRKNAALLRKVQVAFEKKTGQLARENDVLAQRLGIPSDVTSRRHYVPVEGKRMTTIPEDAGAEEKAQRLALKEKKQQEWRARWEKRLRKEFLDKKYEDGYEERENRFRQEGGQTGVVRARTSGEGKGKRPDLISFVKAGAKPRKKAKKERMPKGWLWRGVSDWCFGFDLKEYCAEANYVFPHVACATDLRPDGFLISLQAKCVIVVELTVPWEENVAKWHKKKTERYEEIRENAEPGWEVFSLVLEVGARGWVPRSATSNLRALGMDWPQVKELTSAMSDVARKASYVIFINRFNQLFQPWDATE